MNFTRPILFWIAMLAAVIAVVALLREVLLPFVAGMVLAYLLDPVANRIERPGAGFLVGALGLTGSVDRKVSPPNWTRVAKGDA